MSSPGPIPVLCFVCGSPATLADEQKSHADFDCDACGRLRVTGRVMFLFPPAAMRSFDRAWLSAKARAIRPAKREGGRRLVDEAWLHQWRLVTLLMLDLGLDENQACHQLARHPGIDRSGETLLAVVAAELGRTPGHA